MGLPEGRRLLAVVEWLGHRWAPDTNWLYLTLAALILKKAHSLAISVS